MKDDRDGEIIHRDPDGRRYVLDENGNRRPPMQSEPVPCKSGFLTFDDSEGHCPLCGQLTCRGGCFR